MQKVVRALIVVCAGLLFAGSAMAEAGKGSTAEAKAMVEKALGHIKKVGNAQAFKDFSDPANKEWHDRDLYLYAYNFTGENVAHGVNAKLIGKNLLEMKTPDGKLLIKEMVDLVKAKGEGWIDFDWPHPESKKIEHKSGFVKRIAGSDVLVGSGVYK